MKRKARELVYEASRELVWSSQGIRRELVRNITLYMALTGVYLFVSRFLIAEVYSFAHNMTGGNLKLLFSCNKNFYFQIPKKKIQMD